MSFKVSEDVFGLDHQNPLLGRRRSKTSTLGMVNSNTHLFLLAGMFTIILFTGGTRNGDEDRVVLAEARNEILNEIQG